MSPRRTGSERRDEDAAVPDRDQSKVCEACGRRFGWRKKWERDWETVRYCSQACRRRGVRPEDAQLERAILEQLAARRPAASICPSEAARAVAGPQADEATWRALMEPARRAARRLVERGEVVITQGGRVVDPSSARGPIRIQRADGAGRPNPGR